MIRAQAACQIASFDQSRGDPTRAREEHCARLGVSRANFVEDVMPDKYVDAYVVPVPKSKVGEYKAFTKNIRNLRAKAAVPA